MDFTGERFIPDADPDSELEMEHLLRYQAVVGLAAGKAVLDAASGEGYGSALIAGQAREVVGLDVDPQAVAQAQVKYPRPNLAFVRGSVERLPFPDARFDLVVSFETIEHVHPEAQEAFLVEIKRVLRPGGLLVMSTPDRRLYSDRPGYRNQFHLREFYRQEFEDFLHRWFSEVRLWEQTAVLAYVLATGREKTLRQALPAPGGEALELRGKYMVAVCSDVPQSDMELGCLALDRENHYQRKVERVVALQDEIEDKNKHIFIVLRDIEYCQRTVEELELRLAAREEELAATKTSGEALRSELAGIKAELATWQRRAEEGERLRAELNHIRGTRGFRFLQLVYRLKARLGR